MLNHEYPPNGRLIGASKETTVYDLGKNCSSENKSSLLLPYP
jgi:hypothetical protein